MPIPRIPERSLASHVPSESTYHPSRGAMSSRQSIMNRGTLNIFSGECTKEATDAVAETNARRMTRYSSANLLSGRHYHNRESNETREFPPACIRHVQPPSHTARPQGIKHVSNAAGNKQQVQIVNLTRAYVDPANMTPPRACVRCVRGKGYSEEMKSILAYRSLGENQLKGSLAGTPLGKPRPREARRVIDYTRQENFLKSVCDHVQQRVGGIAGFYVLLARGAVGEGVSTHPVEASPSDGEDRRKGGVLTLGRCRDQLIRLIGIPVTLLELADLVWGPGGPKDLASLSEEGLESLQIPFKDFATAFGTHLFGRRLPERKIRP
ncbi:unnamed protein product [Phytomonas sp. EM1]|nr:unnamed protein product [Phytomonas sp. EM1]|eukprot:CCW62480.1 unnamed protein product [Phytomonas sp. isolate EM1]